MCEADLQRCLAEIRNHEEEIGSLSRTLAELGRTIGSTGTVRGEESARLARHAEFINAQVMRHRISVALLQSRLGAGRGF